MIEAEIERALDALRQVSDDLMKKNREVAKDVDRAIAYISMNDNVRARHSLDQAIKALPPYAVLEKIRKQLPQNSEIINTQLNSNLMYNEEGFIFHQCPSQTGASVIIPIAKDISRNQINVTFKSRALLVSIQEHDILNGQLAHPIESSACSWYLDTELKSGDRFLVLHIEKLSGEFVWPTLFRQYKR